jgi:hypothetical protein
MSTKVKKMYRASIRLSFLALIAWLENQSKLLGQAITFFCELSIFFNFKISGKKIVFLL